MENVWDKLPPSPSPAYVVRRAGKARNPDPDDIVAVIFILSCSPLFMV
jgi:hypothetical protein